MSEPRTLYRCEASFVFYSVAQDEQAAHVHWQTAARDLQDGEVSTLITEATKADLLGRDADWQDYSPYGDLGWRATCAQRLGLTDEDRAEHAQAQAEWAEEARRLRTVGMEGGCE